MGASQRAKGATAEREVAAILQEWWRQLEPGCRFVRTPSSGGWHGRDGGGIRADFRASGDLMTTAKLFPFTVEVKRREGWTWESLHKPMLTRKGAPRQTHSPVWLWWRQAQAQAVEQGGGLVPMLVFRRSREPWRVLIPKAWWERSGFALWRQPVAEWLQRWPVSRGQRPVCHYLLEMTDGLHPSRAKLLEV